MKRFIAITMIFVGAAVLTNVAMADDEAAVKQWFQKYADMWNAADLAALSNALAEDVVQMTPSEAFVGKNTVTAEWRRYLGEYTDTWHPKIIDVRVSGNMAYIRYSFTEKRTPKKGGPTQTMAGNAVEVLRREGGEWKVLLETWFETQPWK